MTNETKHTDFSPSGFARRFHCPASYALEKGKQETVSAIADEGTRIHAEIAGLIGGKIDLDSADPLSQRCYSRFESVVNAFENPSVYVEKTLSATIGATENSGTMDCLVIGGEDACLVDWKTGFNRVDFPDRNWQIFWYVVFVFDNFPAVQGIKATVFNPRIWQDDSAYFKREQLAELKARLGDVIAKCLVGSPAPQCGEWCDYCRAKGECPAVKNALQAMANTVPLSRMGDADLTALADKITAVKTVCDDITEELKRRIRKNGSCNGYTIKTISGATEIADAETMLERLAKWLTPDEVAVTAKYSVTALADAVYSKRKSCGEKVTKVSAKADLVAELDGCLSKRPDQERIVKNV